ncbi:MAG: hypothetical protein GIW95_03265, partial [Candidatus Eremiobacteraeota bacterium]|nr:hypothetical protein [Candidatus Eremiobacteraeota bacterium]
MKREPLIAGAIAFCALAVASGLHPTVYNNYVLLADAFLHGHAAIAWTGEYIEAIECNCARYV